MNQIKKSYVENNHLVRGKVDPNHVKSKSYIMKKMTKNIRGVKVALMEIFMQGKISEILTFTQCQMKLRLDDASPVLVNTYSKQFGQNVKVLECTRSFQIV